MCSFYTHTRHFSLSLYRFYQYFLRFFSFILFVKGKISHALFHYFSKATEFFLRYATFYTGFPIQTLTDLLNFSIMYFYDSVQKLLIWYSHNMHNWERRFLANCTFISAINLVKHFILGCCAIITANTKRLMLFLLYI